MGLVQTMLTGSTQRCCFTPVVWSLGVQALAILPIDIDGPPGAVWSRMREHGKLRLARPPSGKALKPLDHAPPGAIASG